MAFIRPPIKYDRGEAALYPAAASAYGAPLSNDSGTWIPLSVPTLHSRLSIPQEKFIHSLPGMASTLPFVGIGQPLGTLSILNSNTNNFSTFQPFVNHAPSTFENGTVPRVGNTYCLNASSGFSSSSSNTQLYVGVLTPTTGIGTNLSLASVGGFANVFWQSSGVDAGTTFQYATGLLTTNPAGTLFCMMYVNSSNTPVVVTSPDGVTWTNQTVTSHIMNAYGSGWAQNMAQSSTGTSKWAPRSTNGWKTGMGYQVGIAESASGYSGSPCTYVNCGARIISVWSVNMGSPTVYALRSTNGFTFGGDETSAILGVGGGNAPVVNSYFFHRNNNSCFMIAAGYNRFTTDGGVTWATSSNFTQNFNLCILPNTTTLSSLCGSITGSAGGYVSTNTGASWTNITFPEATLTGNTTRQNSSLAYAGSTMVYLGPSGSLYYSTNNGTTWSSAISQSTLGVTGVNPVNIVHDGFRFIALYPGVVGALSTSTDGITWTARSVPVIPDAVMFTNSMPSGSAGEIGSAMTTGGYALTTAAALDSNYTLIVSNTNNSKGEATTNPATGFLYTTASNNRCIFTNDGGVTWYSASIVAMNGYYTTCGVAGFTRDLVVVNATGSTSSTRGFISGNMFIPQSDLDNLGNRTFLGGTSLTSISHIKIG